MLISFLFLVLSVCVAAAAEDPPLDLPHSSPEEQGISSAAISAFVEAAENEVDALHSLMLLRRGHIVAAGWWAPYERQAPHRLYSLSKSFTATAIGLAQAENLLSIDDLVLSHFPKEAPAKVDSNLAQMRIRDLLSMTTGHHEDTLEHFFAREDGQWTQAFLQLPVPHKPGTHYSYNTGATYMLAAIVQKVSGETLRDYLVPRLFAPLNIATPTWRQSPEGINVGGWGLSITTEDIARFGQLYLQRENGADSSCCPPPGSSRPPRARPPMAATQPLIRNRATASNFGAAGTTPIAPMALLASFALSSLTKKPY